MHLEQFQITADLETRHWWFVARRRILSALIAEVLGAARERLIVDVGCGTGGNVAALHAAYTCVGVDCSRDAVALARRRFPQARFVCGTAPDDVQELIADADLILLTDVLEHVEDDRRLLAELAQAARPGAHLLLTVPADMRLWSRHDESHGHYRRYDQTQLAALWSDSPISAPLLSYFNARLHPIVRAVRAVGCLRGKSFGAADTDLRLPARPLNWLLERVFAGERTRLLRALRRQAPGYRRGVSLIALLRRAAENRPPAWSGAQGRQRTARPTSAPAVASAD